MVKTPINRIILPDVPRLLSALKSIDTHAIDAKLKFDKIADCVLSEERPPLLPLSVTKRILLPPTAKSYMGPNNPYNLRGRIVEERHFDYNVCFKSREDCGTRLTHHYYEPTVRLARGIVWFLSIPPMFFTHWRYFVILSKI